MKEDILKGITSSISEKLGEENSSIIADDIGKLITANTQTIETINSLNKRISTLEETNQKLIQANGSLLQQIPAVADYEKHQTAPEEEEKKTFNFHAVFDKNGNFKKTM
jgi:prefoldin subunit 5